MCHALQAVVVRDVFAGQPELFERFKKFIGFTSDDELGTAFQLIRPHLIHV
jgi:hypothetical protein